MKFDYATAAQMQTQNPRLVPVQVPGKGWKVEIRTGSRKAGTLRTADASEPVYTLAQAECFCRNNSAGTFLDLLS